MGALSDSGPYLLVEADSLGLTNGAAVSSVTAGGSGGVVLAQATTTSQPIYVTGATPAGVAAISFDGVDDALIDNTAAYVAFQRQTLMAVVKVTGGASTNRTILGTGSSSGLILRVNVDGKAELLTGAGPLYATGATAIPSGFVLLTGTFAWTPKVSATSTSGIAWPELAFDGGTANGWTSAVAPSVGTPQRIWVEYATAAVSTALDITCATTSTAPKDFTIEGSNDGSAWTTLDTRTGVTWASSVQTQTFSFTNSTAYKFYRVSVTAAATAVGVQIREISTGIAFTRTAEVRVSGISDGTGTPTTSVGTGSAVVTRLGSQATNTTSPFNGQIAFAARWDRVLTPAEITAVEAEVTAKYLGSAATTASVSATLPAIGANAAGSVTATGVVAASLAGITATATGSVTVTGQIAASLPALTAQVDGSVSGVVSGTMEASLAPLSASVNGDVTVPTLVSGASAVTLPGITAAIRAAGPEDLLAAHSVTRITSGLLAPFVADPVTAHSTTRITSTVATPTVIETIAAHSTTIIRSSALPGLTIALDPVTGRPQYRLFVVDRQGNPLGELENARIGDPVRALQGAGVFTATLPKNDPKATLLDVGAEVQVWAGAEMLPDAWYVLIEPGKDGGGEISYQFVGLEGLLDNVVIGKERPDLLVNGGFEDGLRNWHPTWLAGSAAQAPPKTTIVTGSSAKEGGRALQVEAVESVNAVEVKTAAIFYGNRPYASEALSAGFLPGGEKVITDQLPAFSHGTALLVEGFTADVDSGDGQALSERRALAAKAVIVKARPDLKVTAVGRGETIQVAPNNTPDNQAKNRRILLTGTATRVGHRQVVQQFFKFRNDTRAPIELELDGWINLINYVGPSKDRYGFYINRHNRANKDTDPLPPADSDRTLLEEYAVQYAGMTQTKAESYDTAEALYAAIVAATPSKAKIVAAEHTDLSEDFPHEKWEPDGTSIIAPPDGREYLYEVRLYGSAGKTIFDEVSCKPNFVTGFYGVTRPQLFAGLVAHAQDSAFFKVDLNIDADCPPVGVRNDFEYEWKSPRTVWDAISEQLRSDDSPDFWIQSTPQRRVARTAAKRGRRSPVRFRLGDIVTGYTAGVDGGKVATTGIVTSNRSRGGGVAEARIRTGPVNGLVLERVQSAEPDRSTARLRQMGAAMTRYGRTDVLTSVTCDPEWTVYLLGHVGLGDTAWFEVKDGDTDVAGWYRIVEIRHSISNHQLSYELAPEV